MTRTRTRDYREPATGYFRFKVRSDIAIYWDTALNGKLSECTDIVGQWETDNPLVIKHKLCHYPQLWSDPGHPEGINPYLMITKCFHGYPIGRRFGPEDPTGPFPYPDWIAVASEVAAKSNPSVAHISVPTFVGEAREFPALLASIPQLIRGRGRSLIDLGRRTIKGRKANPIKRAASAHLAWRFGWRPLLADLATMLGVLDAIQKRIDMLKRLQSGHSLKRRVRLTSLTASTDWGRILTHSAWIYVYHQKETSYSSKSWGTARWTLDPGASLPTTEAGLYDLALRLTLGFTSFEAIVASWELLPWSWLIDWFLNVGQWLQAINNTLPVTLSGINWMRRSTSQSVYTKPEISAGTHLEGWYTESQTTLERKQVPHLLAYVPSLSTIPALTSGQMSILGSLLAQSKAWIIPGSLDRPNTGHRRGRRPRK